MSNFQCPHCQTPIIEGPNGQYVTGCNHYHKETTSNSPGLKAAFDKYLSPLQLGSVDSDYLVKLAEHYYDPIIDKAKHAGESESYPCVECGKLRTKAEGGTTFTVCDECWDKKHPPETTNHTEMCGIHDGDCFVCGEKTNSYALSPGEWAIFLPHIDGQKKHRFYHIKCLYPVLKHLKGNQEN